MTIATYGGKIIVKQREHIIKTMLARLVYEFYPFGSHYDIRTFHEADIPTRDAVERLYKKLEKHLQQ